MRMTYVLFVVNGCKYFNNSIFNEVLYLENGKLYKLFDNVLH